MKATIYTEESKIVVTEVDDPPFVKNAILESLRRMGWELVSEEYNKYTQVYTFVYEIPPVTDAPSFNPN